MIEKALEKLKEKCKESYEIWVANKEDKYADGKNEGFIEALNLVQEVAKEYCNNIILDFLQFVRDNADREEFDNEDGWALSDLITLATEFAPYQKGEPKKDCNTCANNTDFDEVDNGCYMCCKGLENNYEPIEQKGE